MPKARMPTLYHPDFIRNASRGIVWTEHQSLDVPSFSPTPDHHPEVRSVSKIPRTKWTRTMRDPARVGFPTPASSRAAGNPRSKVKMTRQGTRVPNKTQKGSTRAFNCCEHLHTAYTRRVRAGTTPKPNKGRNTGHAQEVHLTPLWPGPYTILSAKESPTLAHPLL